MLTVIIGAALALPWPGIIVNIPVSKSSINHEIANAYLVVTPGVFRSFLADDSDSRPDYPQLFEDERIIGPSRAQHENIRNFGGGVFALNNGHLRFSSSDNSNPIGNQRSYVLKAYLENKIILILAAVLLFFYPQSQSYFLSDSPNRRSNHSLIRRLSSSALSAGFLAIISAGLIDLVVRFATVARIDWTGKSVAFFLLASTAICFWRLVFDYLFALHNSIRANRLTQRLLSRLGVLTLIAVASAWFSILWIKFQPVADYSDTVALSLWKAGIYTPVDGSIQAYAFSGIPLLLPSVFAGLASFSGISILDLHVAFSAVAFGVAITSAVMLPAMLARSPWAGAISLPIATGGWLTTAHLGYPYLLFSPTLLLGTWGLGMACATLVTWLLLPRTRFSVVATFAAIGVSACVHLTYGAIVFAIVLMAEALRCIGPNWRREAVTLAMGLAIFLTVVSPQLFEMFRSIPLASAVQPAITQDWWRLMAFRKPFHVFIWGENGVASGAGWLLLVSILLWLNLATYATRLLLVRLGSVIIVTTGLLMVSYIVVEVLPTPRLAGMVLSRGSLLLLFLISGIVAALPFMAARAWWQNQNPKDAWRVIFLMVGLIGYMLPTASIIAKSIVGSAYLLAALIPHVGINRVYSARTVAAFIIIPLMGGLGWTLTQIPEKLQVQENIMPKAPPHDWQQLTSFLREKSDRSQMVLMPPYPYATSTAQRSWPLDYMYSGVSVYLTSLATYEIRILKTIYGVDISNIEPSSIPKFIAASGGILCLYERGYNNLISDADRIMSLRSEWPSLGYVVGFKRGVMPYEWGCDPFNGSPLNFPILFENDSYIIYTIPH